MNDSYTTSYLCEKIDSLRAAALKGEHDLAEVAKALVQRAEKAEAKRDAAITEIGDQARRMQQTINASLAREERLCEAIKLVQQRATETRSLVPTAKGLQDALDSDDDEVGDLLYGLAMNLHEIHSLATDALAESEKARGSR